MVTRLEHIGASDGADEDSILREWLEKEIAERERLQQLLFLKVGLIHDEVVRQDTTDYQPVNRHTPFRIRRARKELEQRNKAKQARGEAVEVASPSSLSEGEKIFQSALEAK